MTTSPDFRLGLFASPSLTTGGGASLTGRPIQRHRLALLALLARAPESGVARDVLMAHLWPESDPERARNLLNVSVYVLRRALGDDAIVSAGSALRLATEVVEVDVVTFGSALARGDRAAAVSLYRGPFLEGFFLKDAPEFGHWVDRERSRLADEYARALESLAEEAEAQRDAQAATERWKALAAHDPYDSRIALRLMRALAASGSRAGALHHAELHERLLHEELDIEPPPEIAAFVTRLRTEPAAEGGLEEPKPRTGDAEGSASPPGARPPEPPRPPDTGPPPTSGEPTTAAIERAPDSGTSRPRRIRVVLSVIPLLTAVVILATEVVRERGARPPAPTGAVLQKRPTASVPAYELYRRASQTEVLRSDSAARVALDLFARAVEMDPAFAAAHAGLARLHIRIPPPEDPGMSLADRLDVARRHAVMATELDDSLAEGHATLGITEMSLYAFDAAEAHLWRALELDPGFGRAREYLSRLFIWRGRPAEALELAGEALAGDPLSATARAEVARALMVNGRCDEALAQLAMIENLTPPLLRAGPIAAQCHALEGKWTEALAHTDPEFRDSGTHGQAVNSYFLARAGRRAEATALLEHLLDEAGRTEGLSFRVAMALTGLGRLDEAIAWLERSVDDHSFSPEVMEPMFGDLHGDPRFRSLVERIGLQKR